MLLSTLFLVYLNLLEVSSWNPIHPAIFLSDLDSKLMIYTKVYDNKVNILKQPNFPDFYDENDKTNWIVEAKDGYTVTLNCSGHIPCRDKLIVHTSISSAKEFCGQPTFELISDGNIMVFELVPLPKTRGGTFTCTVRAELKPKACEYCGCNKNSGKTNMEVISQYYTMVGGIYEKKRDTLICAGAIIKDTIIITSAECLTGRTVSDLGVVVSPYDVALERLPSKVKYDVRSIWVPVSDGRMALELVIGYVKTTKMKMSSNVVPACVSAEFTPEKLTGKRVYMLGWHYLNNFHKLLRAEVEHLVTGPNFCNNYTTIASSDTICTVSRIATHMNVRGSPIFYGDRETGLIFFVGLASRLFYVNNEPEYHATTTAHIQWLKDL